MEDGLPPPSPELAIIGAALLEFERIEPGFLSRLRKRIEEDRVRTAVVRLRGPRMSAETLRALDEAGAWIGAASLVADAVQPKKRKRA